MGIMDKLFGGGEGGVSTTTAVTGVTHNAPAAPPGTQPMRPAPAAPAIANNTPAATPAPAAAPSSPLDAFKGLWETPVDAEGKPIAPPVDPLAAPIFNFDPAKVTEQAKALDFTKGINPELVSGLVQNGQLNTDNLLKLINEVSQTAFAAATLNTGNLVTTAVQKNNTALKTALPSQIRGVQLADTPIGDNPVLSHPAVAPLVHALRTAQFTKNPNANPADVNKSVMDYLGGLAEALQATTPAATEKREAVTRGQTNWGNYFDTNAQ